MAFLSKYGVARHIYIPIIKRGVVDFAVSADWTPAAGDVKISKDGGAAASVTNLPVAITMGNTAMWDFSITATEMQGAQIAVTVCDSATKAVEDTQFDIETYGNASAQHAVDLSDSTAAGLSRLDAAVSSRMATFTLPTNFASFAVTAGGAVTVGTNNDKTGYSLTVTPPTSAQIATAVWQDTTAGDFTVASSIGKSLYTSGNAPGAASGIALVGSNMGSVSSVTGAVGSVTGAVGSVTGNVGGSVASVTGAVGSVTAGVTLAAGAVDNVALATAGINAIWNAATRTLTGNAGIKKNTALNAFPILMTDSTTHNPKTGLTVTASRSLDGAAFAACANSVVEVASGWYKIDLAATDLNGNTVALRFTATGADDLNISIATEP